MRMQDGHSFSLKNPFAVFSVILALLAALALYLYEGAARRGEEMAAIVMLIIAVIFINKIQKRR